MITTIIIIIIFLLVWTIKSILKEIEKCVNIDNENIVEKTFKFSEDEYEEQEHP